MRTLLLAFTIVCALAAMPTVANSQGSLFVNLTTDESHRVDMAMAFPEGMMERGHPVTIWLNDKGVLVASRQNAETFAEQQKTLGALISSGEAVIACPMCMKHHGMEEDDLMDGVQLSNPELTGAALFKEDARTLTW